MNTKDMKAKLLMLLSALVASIGLMHAEILDRVQIGGLYYNLDTENQTAEVTYQVKGASGNYSDVTTANIPSSVTYESTSYSVTSIGDYAFYFCTGLTSVSIPNSVTSIGIYSFGNCNALSSIAISNSVMGIGMSAFSRCSSLTSITIPNSVTSIGSDAFSGCNGLNSITIPYSVTNIGRKAFAYCRGLTSIVVDAGNTSYDSHDNCNAIIETSTNALIAGCKNTVIPDGVLSIDDYVFAHCTGLTSVTIPKSVTNIGKSAFSGTSGLTSITVENGNITYDSRNNCNAIIETATNTLITGCQNTFIPNGVTSIESYAFFNCAGLASITIPTTITSIGDYAFYDCEGLTSIHIPSNVTNIGKEAFYSCRGLTSITISDSVINIGNRAFALCSHLTSITDGATTPQTIEVDVFNYVDKSIPLYVPAESVEAYRAADGWKDFTNIQPIPCIVASGTCGAEGDSTNLTWELSCDSVLTISGTGAMADYEEETAPWYANRNKIKAVVVESGITNIGDYAFCESANLTLVTICNSVINLGERSFYGCSNLVSCNIPNSVITIGNSAFRECTSLRSVTIGSNVTSIGNSVFYNCTSLQSVNIPGSVTSLGRSVFSHCSALTSITIPSGVTSIGGNIFNKCTGLTSITCEAVTPLSLTEEDVFNGVSMSIALYVPCLSVNAYKAADYWSDFADIWSFDGVPYSYSVTSADVNLGTVIVSHEPTCSDMTLIFRAVPAVGYVFNQWSDGNTDNPRTLTVTQDTTLTAEFAKCIFASGTCGAEGDSTNLTWELSCDSVLTISGTGVMADYDWGTTPWNEDNGKIKTVIVGEGVTSIGNLAFNNCTNLVNVSFPESITSIGDYVFVACTNLTAIDVAAANTSFCSVDGVVYNKDRTTLVAYPGGKQGAFVMPNTVTGMATGVFWGYNLTSVTLSDNLTSISTRAFSGCTGLTSLTIPNAVTNIGDDAFSGCADLTSILIPNSVISLGIGAFWNCSALTSITCEAITPPACGSYIFDNVDKAIPLYVPIESVKAYRTADEWREFSNITPLLYGASELTINNGSATNEYVPVYGYWADAYTHTQFIVPSDVLATVRGSDIRALKFYSTSATKSWGDASFEVRMMETMNELNGSYMDTNAATLVYSGALDVENNEMYILFDESFAYHDADVLIDIRQAATGTYSQVYWYGSNTGQVLYGYNSSGVAYISANTSTFSPKVTFTCTSGDTPFCPRPQTFSLSDVAIHAATISWEAQEGVSGYEYVLLREEEEFTETGKVAVPETTVALTNLSAETNYKVYVRSNCGESGEEKSGWSKPFKFHTLCDTVTAFPWIETFNNQTSGMLICWDNQEGTTTFDNYKWSSYASGHEGRCVRFDSYNNTSGYTNILATPLLTLPEEPMQLTFWCKNPAGGDYSVSVAADGGERQIVLSGLTNISDWNRKKVDLTAYAGQTIQIFFNGTSNYGTGDAYLYLDEVEVKPISYYLVGGFTDNWSLDSAIPFEKIDGIYTANVPDINGSFKIVSNRDWRIQWGSLSGDAGMTMGTGYTMARSDNYGDGIENTSFANPFTGYHNAVFTLTEDNNSRLVLTLESGEAYVPDNNWYLAGGYNSWMLSDDYKFAPSAFSDSLVLNLSEWSGDFKLVFGTWNVEYGANSLSDTWQPNSGYTLTFPAAGSFAAGTSRVYNNVRITILPDYTAATVAIRIETAAHVTIGASNGTVDFSGGYVRTGESVQVTVTPEDGYTFSYWSDFSTENPRTFVADEDISVNAVCVPINPVVYQLCLAHEDEKSVYFIKPDTWTAEDIYCYMWDDEAGQMTADWPGDKASAFTENLYKFMVPDGFGPVQPTWNIIWNNGSSANQTEDHKYLNNAVFSIETDVTYGHGNITTINYVCTDVCSVVNTIVYDTLCAGFRYYHDGEIKLNTGDYQDTSLYISPVGGDSVVVYNLHVDDCGQVNLIDFELRFKSNGTTSDTGSEYPSKTTDVFTANTAAYAGNIFSVSKVYPGKTVENVDYGAKFASSTRGGSMTFTLANPLNVDSVIFSVAKYNSSTTHFFFNGREVSLSASSGFERVKLDGIGWLDTLTVASDGTMRFYLQGIRIYGKTDINIRYEDATICEGDTYNFHGESLTGEGHYRYPFKVDEIDSVLIMRLHVIKRQYVVVDYDTITTTQQTQWHGQTILYPGSGDHIYYDTVPSLVTGCDSINELMLHVEWAAYPELTLSLDKDTVSEGTGTMLTITSSYAMPVDETIKLTYESSRLSDFPSSVVMPAGSTVVTIPVNTKDNSSIQTLVKSEISAKGSHFYGTVRAYLYIEDNDTPEIHLSLSVSEVDEGAGLQSIVATVERVTNTDRSIYIYFSDNSDGAIRYPSSSLQMKSGVTTLTATLGVVENNLCEGNRDIEIVARVNGADMPCGFDTAHITVVDNDIPVLNMQISTNMLLEGKSDAAVITVSRNTPTDTDLQVTLEVNNPEGLTFPATLTIPTGQAQAQTTVAVERNGIGDDSHQIVFTATSQGYVSAMCYAMVIDQTLPDAVISAFSVSEQTAEAATSVNVSVTVLNQGAAGLAKGITVNVYLAGSRVCLFALSAPLPIGETVTFSEAVILPERVGNYTLYATVNEDMQVKEILTNNNRSGNQSVTVVPSFEVLSLTASKKVCMPGDSVILNGQLSGSKAANAEVEIYAVNSGYRRSFKVTADASGAFTAVFRPQTGQTGHFAVGACYPSERSTAEMVGVNYYGMEVAYSNITCMLNTGYDYNGSINVRNTGSLTINNIRAVVTDNPGDCHIELTNISALQGGRSGNIGFLLRADNNSEGSEWQTIGLQILSDEGLQAEKTIYYYSRDPRGSLICSESSLTATISIQQPLDYTIYLQNTGLGESGDITLGLPEWIQSVTPQIIPSIAPNEYAEVILRINTARFAGNLNIPVQGAISINPENCSSISLPFTITPVSDISGTIRVDVCDENTYYAEGHPHVMGAQVLVKNYYTRAVVAQGLTNASGIYEAVLPEGYYTISVTADNHDSYTNNIRLMPEETTALTVNLSIKAIAVSWKVEETEVEDTYEIVTTVKYETHVPQPVVVVDAPSRIAADELQEGESMMYSVTVTNQGLIRAEDVTITLPGGGGAFSFEALAYAAPFNLEAKQSVVIPVKVTRLAEAQSAPARANSPHGILECHDNMLTLYYWDCGTDRKWHQYAVPLVYARCDDEPTLPTIDDPEPDDPHQPVRPGTIPVSPFTWPTCIDCGSVGPGGGWYIGPDEPGTIVTDEGCEPCQNQFILNCAKLGLDVASLASNFWPQKRLLTLAKAAKGAINSALETRDCYNETRQAHEELTWLPALTGCLAGMESEDWDDIEGFLMDEITEELGDRLEDALLGFADGDNDGDDDDDGNDNPIEEIFEDATDVWNDLVAFTHPCEHTAENAAYSPARSASSDEYAGEPEHLARFKRRTRVVLDEIEARNCLLKLFISDSVRMYCSNAEIIDLWGVWQNGLLALPTEDDLMSIRPVALPDEQWQGLVERINNTYQYVHGSQPANDNYVHQDSIAYYADKIASCEAKSQEWGYETTSKMFGNELNILLEKLEAKSGSVCASISLQFEQKMTLTRQAFRGTLSVFNGHETEAMTDIRLDLSVRAVDNGQEATSHEFQISLEKLEDMSGEAALDSENGWTIAANTTGTATILFIPTVNAAPQADRVWSFGGTLTYTDPFTGLTVTRELYPVQLTVKPSPLLQMTYFMQRDVYADDPLTAEIEEAEPAEFALLINNVGNGYADNVNLQTQEPKIVDNKKGLLIDFHMLYALLNSQKKSLPVGGSVTTQFGTIPAHSQAYAQWFFQSTLLGHFTSYDVTATHVTSYDNPDLSLIDTVTIHEMLRSIDVPATGAAATGWLVNDDGDIADLPEKLYLSDGTIEAVHTDGDVSISRQDAQNYILTVTPESSGWNYGYCADPTGGRQLLQNVIRLSDNREISLRNVWHTPCVMRDQEDPVHIHRLHIADNISGVTSYRLVFSETDSIIVSDEQDIATLSVSVKTDLVVKPTGHLTVSQPVTVRTLTLEYGLSSHAQVSGVENLSVESAEMVLTIPASKRWVAFAVPFEVDIQKGIRIEGEDHAARYGYDYIINRYDGDLRASTQNGWQRLSASATLRPGTLYMIYTASATTWRLTAADASALTEASSVAVAAYPSATGDHHAGWNGIANTRWSNAEAALEDVNFASLYDNAYGVYRVEPLGTYTFAAAEPFFVQAVADDAVTFDRSAASAPWRVAQDRPAIYTLTLRDEDQTFTDKAYLTFSPEKDNRYTVGCDLEKMQVAAPAVPQLWIEAYSMRLAAHTMPSDGEARILPIGMYVPVAGTYVMAMQELPEALSVSLTKDGQTVWVISESAALVPLNAGDNGGYALYIHRLPEVVTDLPTNETGMDVQKVIIDDKLYIIREGKVYTATGARVQ